MQKSLRDLLAGLVFIALGAAFAGIAATYPIGTALRMGPGFFPVVLGGLLVLLGLAIVAESRLAGDPTPIGPVPWRGIVLLSSAILFFGFTVRGLGLAPALFVATLLAAFSSARTGWLTGLLTATALTIACILVFVEALNLTVPVLGPWLGN